MHNSTILVVGGNAAGPAAAAKAKRVNPDAEVILFEAGKYISTGTCELPYVLSKDIADYKDIVFFDDESFQKKKNVTVYTHSFVQSIDRRNKSILAKDLRTNKYIKFNYDKLILTTGSKSIKIPTLDENLTNVFYLKSVENLLSIQSFLNIKTVKKILIIGAGYIGLETAESFLKLGYDVTILEKFQYPMPAADPEIQRLILNQLEQKRINFIGGSSEQKFIMKDDRFSAVKIDGRIMEFDMVLVSVGFEPNNMLALSSKLELGKFGGLKIDNRLKTSDPNIYAAGDNIEVANFITGRPAYFPVATYAHSAGHIAGANSAGDNQIFNPVIKNIAVKLFDKSFAQVGLTESEAKEYCFDVKSVTALADNLVHVMPSSRKVFGKIIYDGYTKNILGASFLGGPEVTGYADLISMMIMNKISAVKLVEANYNYTPPLSPFINLLSVLGRKIKKGNL
ncbi:MAG: FAD-dependent oxidoreductase [Melioribacteraceae bacterium]|nr:FAD-dependent oxidoreductase [Melioribacteraceae bacterium]